MSKFYVRIILQNASLVSPTLSILYFSSSPLDSVFVLLPFLSLPLVEHIIDPGLGIGTPF
jgi:hypothetical protein